MITRMTHRLRWPLLAASVAALTLLTTTALAGSGVGGVFNLGQVNTVDAQTSVSGNPGGSPELKVTSTGTAAAVRGVAVNGIGTNGVSTSGVGQQGLSDSGIGALGTHGNTTGISPGVQGETNSTDPNGAGVVGKNNGGGPGLKAIVNAGAPPLSVNSLVRVVNLNADLLDGLDSLALQKRVTGTCAAGSAVKTVNADGTVVCEPVGVAGAWGLSGNSGTIPGTNFLGTTDNKALELKVNGQRALRIEPDPNSPNLIGGYPGNSVGVGLFGAVIAGGGLLGSVNTVTGGFGTIGGGWQNTAAGSATVEGGQGNLASGDYSAVAGGFDNTASDNYSTVAGGYTNTASGLQSAVAGGNSNTASGLQSAVAGGNSNTASGGASAVVAGTGNNASGGSAIIGAGADNLASANYAAIGAGQSNTASGLWSVVAGGHGNRAGGSYSALAGGDRSWASGDDSTVAGGELDTASGFGSAVGGGSANLASGTISAVAGGSGNIASGYASTVPGGWVNTAHGDYSFAAGTRAKANHGGAFVWADSQDADMASSAADQFIARAQGHFFLQSDSTLDNQGGFINTSTGAFLSTGGTWTNNSDRALKHDLRPVNSQGVLERVARMPVTSWSYKAEKPSIRHVGPMAQDFYKAFGLGLDNKHITTIDEGGVALAAVQGLYRQNQALRAQLQAQDARLTRLEHAFSVATR